MTNQVGWGFETKVYTLSWTGIKISWERRLTLLDPSLFPGAKKHIRNVQPVYTITEEV